MTTSKLTNFKRYFLLFSFFLSFSAKSIAQSGSSGSTNKTASQSEAEILSIRQAYQKINSLNLTKQKFTYESSGCVEGGVVTYFLDKGQILKVTESGSIGDGSWINQYYYNLGKVIFCLETLIGGPAIGKVTKTEYRYYIKNGKAFRVMRDSKIIPADSKADEAIQIAGKIYKAYTTRDFVAALCN